jgi:hypothetical protein
MCAADYLIDGNRSVVNGKTGAEFRILSSQLLSKNIKKYTEILFYSLYCAYIT